MKIRRPSIYPKHSGKPCPKNLQELSNCEKEGFADSSVPDCDDSKEGKPAVWSEWGEWSGCKGICGKQGKVIHIYEVTNIVRNI